MLEQTTLIQAIQFILSAGGIAVILQRIPGWEAWQSSWKFWIVSGLNLIAGFILPAVLAKVPADLGSMTLDKIVISVAMIAASFVIHQLDQLLTAFAQLAKARAFSTLAQFKAARAAQLKPGDRPGYPA